MMTNYERALDEAVEVEREATEVHKLRSLLAEAERERAEIERIAWIATETLFDLALTTERLVQSQSLRIPELLPDSDREDRTRAMLALLHVMAVLGSLRERAESNGPG